MTTPLSPWTTPCAPSSSIAVDGDVLARHAGVAAVDDERLVARAADRERKRVGAERDGCARRSPASPLIAKRGRLGAHGSTDVSGVFGALAAARSASPRVDAGALVAAVERAGRSAIDG